MNTTSLSRPGHQARGSVTVLSTLYFRSDDDVCPLLSADAANYNNYITAAFYFLPLIIRIINLHFTDHYPAGASTQFRGCVSISEPWWWMVAQFSSLPTSPQPQPGPGRGGTIAILSWPRHDRDGSHLPAFISFHFVPSSVSASKPIQDEFPADDDDDDTLTISDKPVIPESVISLITRHQYQAPCVAGTRPPAHH